jgi:hypothetical protein
MRRYRGSKMCRGIRAPGRRTTFKGKSGIRSGRMGPIRNDNREATGEQDQWQEVDRRKVMCRL